MICGLPDFCFIVSMYQKLSIAHVNLITIMKNRHNFCFQELMLIRNVNANALLHISSSYVNCILMKSPAEIYISHMYSYLCPISTTRFFWNFAENGIYIQIYTVEKHITFFEIYCFKNVRASIILTSKQWSHSYEFGS